MTAKQPRTDGHSQVHGEHGHLRHLTDSILETMTARASSCQVIADMFSELNEHTLEHFRHEESGGYFSEALERAPRLSERADELLGQHPVIVEQLDELQTHATKPSSNETWWNELEQMFQRFLEVFEEHEVGENELLQNAFLVDIGAED